MNECSDVITQLLNSHVKYVYFPTCLWIRSYHVECTASHQNCEVKRRWAYLVLRWGTTWEQYGAVSFLLLLPS